jgi:hypothetical protein
MKNQTSNIKSILTAAILFASATTQAQTWNTIGNAGTNPATNFIGTSDNKHFRIRTNNQVRMTVDSAGRIGIGTLTPGYMFEVKNTLSASPVSLTSDFSTSANVQTQYVSSRNIGTGGSISARFEAMGGGGGSNTGIIAYAQDGSTNTGISTSVITNTGQTGYGIYASAYGNGTNYAAYLAGKTYISDRLLIGTTSATAKLNLQNTDTALTTFKVYANGGNRLIVDGKGRVMIGTTTPANGYALSVKGKVICDELKVELSTSWPDYVFGKNYKLLSLEEVESHINEFNHLPGIPAAAEMEANGISVGEMQTKLVEKVEELTLYIIQLKKEIETLKQR